MANHKSALKRARQSETRRLRNRINKTKVKNAVKAARASMGETAEISAEALKKAMCALDRAASKGTLHRRNAARRIARLSKQMAAAQKQQAAA
ncbi:30S ribosomal protein S20 [Deltaproteobacteria bacterium Smac51]|nr:30S ribosomal protein S20 [Deltaproteobacteria bacterium Smac51]